MTDMQKIYGGLNDELSDPATRKLYRADPQAAYEKMQEQFSMPGLGEDCEIKVVSSTADTTYIALPSLDSAHILKDEGLQSIQAAGTVGSVGSLASVSSIPSTVFCLGTVATIGSGAPV